VVVLTAYGSVYGAVEAIRAALRETGGNKTQAARVLGIGLRTLHRKVKEYGIS
jgi:DNA-binding NtrC family response regulator